MPNNEHTVTEGEITETTLSDRSIQTTGPIIINQYTAKMNGITEPKFNDGYTAFMNGINSIMGI